MSNPYACLMALLLLGLLSGCVQSSGRFAVDARPPTASVSSAQASVGEAVAVTLTSTFEVDGGSSLAEADFRDIRLGACFRRASDRSEGGYCGTEQPTPLPSWVRLTGRASYLTAFEDMRVRRGETRQVTWSFSFTATEAADVWVSPWADSSSVSGDFAKGGVSVGVAFRD